MKKIIFFFFFIIFAQELSDTIPKKKNYRTYFIASEVAQGITIYSWLLPAGLNLKGRGAVALGLWAPAIAFFGSYPIKKVESEGTPWQSFFGGIGGMARGFFILNKSNSFTFPLLFSLGENIGGYFLSERMKFGSEDAWHFFNFNLLGYYHAGMLNILTNENWERVRYFYFLLSAIEGYGGSILLSREENITVGDVFAEMEYIRVGILSPLSFLAGIQLLSEKSIKKEVYALSSLSGSIVGAFIGHRLSKKRDLTFGQSLLLTFAPPVIEGMILGTAMLVSNFDRKVLGTALILISISHPLGIFFLDKLITAGL